MIDTTRHDVMMATNPADEARLLQRQALRGFVLEACLASCDPARAADTVAGLGATDDALADALFYACASETTYLPFYADVVDVVCRLRGPGAPRAVLRTAAAMGERPKKHAAALVADLAGRGVVSATADDGLPGPFARRLRPRP